jgi:hypothetical protein
METYPKSLPLSFTLINLLLLIAALFLLIISFIPYELIKPMVDSLNYTGTVRFFDKFYFEQMVLRIRILSLFLVFSTLILISNKAYFAPAISNYLLSLRYSASINKCTLFSFIEYFIEDKFHLFAFVLILTVGIIVRIFFLWQPIRGDEAGTFLYYASKPFYIGISSYYTPNNHIFHTLLVHASTQFFGNSVWSIRLPALIAGILLIPISYLFFSYISDKHIAIIASAFISSSSYLIEYSTSARGYTIITLDYLILLAIGYYLVKNTSANTCIWLLFRMVAALGLFTIPIMLIPLIAVLLWMILFTHLFNSNVKYIFYKILLNDLLIIIILTLFLYLPSILVSGTDSIFANSFIAPKSISYIILNLPKTLRSTWTLWNRDNISYICYIQLLGLCSFIFYKFHNKLAIVLLCVANLISIIVVILLKRVLLDPRIIIYLIPIYAFMTSLGLATIIKRFGLKIFNNSIMIAIISIVITLILCINVMQQKTILYSKEGAPFPEAKNIAVFFKQYIIENKSVVIISGYQEPLLYYFITNGIPLKYLLFKTISSERIILVTNSMHSEDIKSILQYYKLNCSLMKNTHLIKSFKLANIYQINYND